MTAPPAITLRFDAGTLLLDGFVEGASEGATLPGCVCDPRVRRYRAPAWRYRVPGLATRPESGPART